MENILIIGGPGTLSGPCAKELLSLGHKVGLYSHHQFKSPSKKGFAFYFGERSDTQALQKAIADSRPTVVIDFICFTMDEARQMYSLLKPLKTLEHFIFVSTCDVYGYPLTQLPFSESALFAPPVSVYAKQKREIELFFTEKNETENLPLTIARPAYSFGDRFLLNIFSRDGGIETFSRIMQGLPVVVMDDGMTLLHASSGENTGRMIAQLATRTYLKREEYTCGHYKAMTHRDYVKLFENALEIPAKIEFVPKTFIESYIRQYPQEGGLVTELTGFNVDFSMQKFAGHFPDFKWRPLQDAMNTYLSEHQDELARHTSTGFEDSLLKAYKNERQRYGEATQKHGGFMHTD